MVQNRQSTEEGNPSAINMAALLILIAIAFVVFVLAGSGNFRVRAIDQRLWLGVETIELTPDVKMQYDILDSNGVLVSRTFMGSPAQIAGIQEGDVLLRWNGISITSQDQFQYLIQTSNVNRRITFTIDRQGKEVLVYGNVGIRPGGM